MIVVLIMHAMSQSKALFSACLHWKLFVFNLTDKKVLTCLENFYVQ